MLPVADTAQHLSRMSLIESDADEPESAPPPSEETLYGVLSDKRRRYTVHFLKQRDEPVAVRELAEQVAAWENEKAPAELSSQERKRVYIALYQSHLPTLDAEGIVEYDEDAKLVSLADGMTEIDMYLEVVPKESVPWSLYYGGLTLLNALLVLLVMYEVEPFTQLPHLGVSVIVLVSFGVSAFVQLYHTRRRRIGDAGPPPEINSTD